MTEVGHRRIADALDLHIGVSEEGQDIVRTAEELWKHWEQTAGGKAVSA